MIPESVGVPMTTRDECEQFDPYVADLEQLAQTLRTASLDLLNALDGEPEQLRHALVDVRIALMAADEVFGPVNSRPTVRP
jgi:uncharacterized protein YfaQ (DUF2300 family)